MTGTVAPPAWFRDAIAVPHREIAVPVAGVTVRGRVWGAPGPGPTLTLVHGGAAHAGWWHFLAPAFLPAWRVVALDLSGHGDADHRDHYRFPVWADEVAAVTAQVAGDGPSVLVGHSMGGVVAGLAAAAPSASRPAGVVVVDTPLHEPDQATIDNADAVFSRVRAHPTREAAVARFRLLPEQPAEHPALVAHVAEHSVRQTPGGWTWKFDPAVFATRASERPADLGATLAAAGVPVGAVVGERSEVVPGADRRRLRDLAARHGDAADGYHEVAGGYHHLQFDQPRALLAALSAILTGWGLPGAGA